MILTPVNMEVSVEIQQKASHVTVQELVIRETSVNKVKYRACFDELLMGAQNKHAIVDEYRAKSNCCLKMESH